MNSPIERSLYVLEPGQKQSKDCAAEIAWLGDAIKLKPQVLNAIAAGKYRAIHHDLLVVCAAIEYADRRWERGEFWARNLQLTIPVRELAVWLEPAVLSCLEHLLRHLTCDNWRFSFVQASEFPEPEGQIGIVFPDKKTFAIAYSDGLDSRAVWALSGSSSEAICIRVAKKRVRAKKGDGLFTRIPFSVKAESRESSFRTRAFQFASVTAIAADIANFSRIVVPESGQGVLSPAMLPLHRIHADYRNHPIFFRNMENFVRLLLQREVNYEQSRIWTTKGQTMCDFLKLPEKKVEHLIETRSCWQVRNVVNYGKRRHCGTCAACILRRFSLFKANVVEPESTYVVSDLTKTNAKEAMHAVRPKYQSSMTSYGIAGVRHFQQFADLADAPDRKLQRHCYKLAEALGKEPEETLENLRSLLSAHKEEWNEFLASLGKKSFVLNWIDGDN